jgi:hypothetical protein
LVNLQILGFAGFLHLRQFSIFIKHSKVLWQNRGTFVFQCYTGMAYIDAYVIQKLGISKKTPAFEETLD